MNSTRHAQANSPSFPDTYDTSLPNQNLIYLDANNLYRWAMFQSLPTHGFRFLQQDEISTLKLQELSDDAEDGYIFQVDLYYPTRLHYRRDGYPLTPKLRNKVKYVVHYRNWRLYIQLGLVVTKVHRVLTFKQLPWLKAYIDFSTRQRLLAEGLLQIDEQQCFWEDAM